MPIPPRARTAAFLPPDCANGGGRHPRGGARLPLGHAAVASCASGIPTGSERALAITRRTLIALAALAVVPVIALAQWPAGASALASPKSLAKDLLPSSYAKKAGFSDVAEKAITTSKTGVKSCPNGAQEAFQNTSSQSGVESEVVGCTTTKAAAALLGGVRSSGAVSKASPPKRLGSSAVEVSGGGSTYAIYWQRGQIVALIALTTDVTASANSSTSTTVATPPITSAEQKVLSDAAIEQDALIG
jgi:hypothetical protein